MIEIEEEKYMYQLVKPDKAVYNRLLEIQKEYPKLTFKNDGYEKLPHKIQEEFADQMLEVTVLLSKTMDKFREFNHFVIGKVEKNIGIRMQYAWDERFKGVGYFDIRHWNPEDHGKY
tara:strand:+ start:1546 stop:1896 length:351 start_codon:yes stop_codon:yes gene_type:complete